MNSLIKQLKILAAKIVIAYYITVATFIIFYRNKNVKRAQEVTLRWIRRFEYRLQLYVNQAINAESLRTGKTVDEIKAELDEGEM